MSEKIFDEASQEVLSALAAQEKVKSNRVPGVKSVLVVLSSRGLVYDIESLRQKIRQTYVDAAVYFLSTMGKPVNPPDSKQVPKNVDLLIDLTGPSQRQCLFFAKKLRRMARVAVGRKAGFFRAKIYDRVFDPAVAQRGAVLSGDVLERERQSQLAVLELAGVTLFQYGDTPADMGRSIALKLPALNQL